MSESDLKNFIESYYEDIIVAMDDADSPETSEHYRLGIRRLAKAFFDKIELFEISAAVPEVRDVDDWYAGV